MHRNRVRFLLRGIIGIVNSKSLTSTLSAAGPESSLLAIANKALGSLICHHARKTIRKLSKDGGRSELQLGRLYESGLCVQGNLTAAASQYHSALNKYAGANWWAQPNSPSRHAKLRQ